MPENTAFGKIAEWSWLSLIAVGGWVWNRFTGRVDHLENKLLEFVVQDDFKEFRLDLFRRWDKFEEKQDDILEKVTDSITRQEFKSELKDVYDKLDRLQRHKVDKGDYNG